MNDEDLLKLSLEIASKTIGFDIKPTKKEDINQTISDIVNYRLAEDQAASAFTDNCLPEGSLTSSPAV